MRIRIAAITGLTLVVGFAVASVTGNRSLGGIVLVLGGAWAARLMVRAAGWRPTVVTLVAVVVLFVVSHPLGLVIGGWPSVLLVATVAALLAHALARPRMPSPA